MADDAISLQASLSPASSALAADQEQGDGSDSDFAFPSDDDRLEAPLPAGGTSSHSAPSGSFPDLFGGDSSGSESVDKLQVGAVGHTHGASVSLSCA